MKKFFIAILTICLLWIMFSIIDVNMHNNPFDNDYKNYSKYNLFIIIEDII